MARAYRMIDVCKDVTSTSKHSRRRLVANKHCRSDNVGSTSACDKQSVLALGYASQTAPSSIVRKTILL